MGTIRSSRSAGKLCVNRKKSELWSGVRERATRRKGEGERVLKTKSLFAFPLWAKSIPPSHQTLPTFNSKRQRCTCDVMGLIFVHIFYRQSVPGNPASAFQSPFFLLASFTITILRLCLCHDISLTPHPAFRIICPHLNGVLRATNPVRASDGPENTCLYITEHRWVMPHNIFQQFLCTSSNMYLLVTSARLCWQVPFLWSDHFFSTFSRTAILKSLMWAEKHSCHIVWHIVHSIIMFFTRESQ